MSKQTIGLLVMAYGTPPSLDDVEAYYTHIRRGRPPSPEQLQDLLDRYNAIGGISPLKVITRGQVEHLEAKLNETSEEYEFKAYMGMRHAPPFIETAVEEMAKDGIKKAVSIVLAPHYSVMSVGGYNKTASEAAQKHSVELTSVNQYHLEPTYIQALVERVEEAFQSFDDRQAVKVVFTAHSLPEKIVEMNDPYVDQLRETAEAIAEQLQLENWETGWQSAAQTNVPWLGPDILDRMRELKEAGTDNLIICATGFVSDHLEILYDLDIECKQVAEELNMQFVRTKSLNTDPLYIEALAQAVLKQLNI
ncbi:ferrochelatase [Ammoniphilus oxalaticus]|uniref:Coproporphyrin III ferrochelatase n=1 Tax=Ammoniphilus oxalaticus TaxID=66863 RepID=A0A419SLX1_9BACL|nr:ferrochelatase [Ammoniphilus oxalaticus]RKD25083.1 ferrochelatase [Ammoniphilus oxalaticus]